MLVCLVSDDKSVKLKQKEIVSYMRWSSLFRLMRARHEKIQRMVLE
jgi:hypothetical protein